MLVVRTKKTKLGIAGDNKGNDFPHDKQLVEHVLLPDVNGIDNCNGGLTGIENFNRTAQLEHT